MSTVRQDLMHLSPEALAQAANMGIVKRAVRELEGGYRPQCTLDGDATLTAAFPDGVTTTWPQGRPIQQAHCTCGAAGVCRHRVIAALAYRASAAETQAEPVQARSPGAASDAAIEQLIPAPLIELARQQLAQGMSIDVRRRASGEPCDTARLPASTVRFWGGDAIETARCDCVRTSACEHVALAVWAFRKADAEHAAEPALQVRLGDVGGRVEIDRTPYVALVEALLRHGVAHGTAALTQPLSTAVGAARQLGATWLDHVLADLEQWSAAYANRSALYDATHGVRIVAELALRQQAGGLPGHARAVLGIGQADDTELDRLRLACLGARTVRDGEQRRTQLVLADLDTGTRLVLAKEWKVPADRLADEPMLRASERFAPGVRLEQLAQGQLLAQQARRRADGSLKLAAARSSQNSVLPQAADWSVLGAPLRFSSVEELVAHKRAYPTTALQARHAAGRFVVFTPARVEQVFYDPNEQAVFAWMTDAHERAVALRRTHEAHTRHALDAVAAALSGRQGELKHVAGVLSWEQGVPVIEPWAFACDQLLVPDFAPPSGALADLALGLVPFESAEPLARALAQGRETLAGLLHHGVKHLPAGWAHECDLWARQLASLGLGELSRRAAALGTLVDAARANPMGVALAPQVMELLALLQLHEDAQVVCALENASPE